MVKVTTQRDEQITYNTMVRTERVKRDQVKRHVRLLFLKYTGYSPGIEAESNRNVLIAASNTDEQCNITQYVITYINAVCPSTHILEKTTKVL